MTYSITSFWESDIPERSNSILFGNYYLRIFFCEDSDAVSRTLNDSFNGIYLIADLSRAYIKIEV